MRVLAVTLSALLALVAANAVQTPGEDINCGFCGCDIRPNCKRALAEYREAEEKRAADILIALEEREAQQCPRGGCVAKRDELEHQWFERAWEERRAADILDAIDKREAMNCGPCGCIPPPHGC